MTQDIRKKSMDENIIDIKNLYKSYHNGKEDIQVLKNINLEIKKGEFVAIVGTSGSGKTTLMNIIGCMDTFQQGQYQLNGKVVKESSADDLAKLRCHNFGFIFQRYNLIASLNALENVALPAIYAGETHQQRVSRAQTLLDKLGLAEKSGNKPNELSGGQQQRVSIARALMNNGNIILADEPTGALDSKTGTQVLEILKQLNEEGHTIILITHDNHIASQANRIIEIKDGEILSDTTKENKSLTELKEKAHSFRLDLKNIFTESFKMAYYAIFSHKLRSLLTMLGIVIGIASVVSVVALGNGSTQNIMSNINSMGTNTIDILPGKGMGDMSSGKNNKLSEQDVFLIKNQPYVDSISEVISGSANLLYENYDLTGQVSGVSTDYFNVKNDTLAQGNFFTQQELDNYQNVVVIDSNTQNKIFPDKSNPVGQTLFIGKQPFTIVGVLAEKKGAFGNQDSLTVYMPYTSYKSRIVGNVTKISSLSIRIKDDYDSSVAESGITNILIKSHGQKDFFTMNTDSIKETIQKTTQTMTLLISAIAVISLVVGGIGVMNIMLVSVTERTREIGIKMAIGARKIHILSQFLIEAIMLCLLGGVIGIAISLIIGTVFNHLGFGFSMIYSVQSIVYAVLCSSSIGVLFGYMPAKNAANMNPINALSNE
jgi:macrolide transport system ATP-binding/permease protein